MFTAWRNKEISFSVLNKLAIPAILSGIIDPVLAFTDQYFVGQLDDVSLSGVSIATTSLMFIVWVFAFIPATASSLVANYFGEKDNKKIGVVISKSIYLALIFSGLVAFIAYISTSSIFELHHTSTDVKTVAQSYFKIRCFGIPLMMLIYSCFGIFRGYQNTVWALKISVFGAIVNIGLDFILIRGITGYIDPMGVEGSAWASVISLILMLVLSAYHLFRLPSDWLMKYSTLVPNKLMLGMSANMIIRLFTLNLTILLAQRIAGNHGDKYLSSLSILMNIWLFTAFFIDGYSTAALALAGKFKGEKQHNLIQALLLKATAINLIIAALLCLGAYLFIENMHFVWDNMLTVQEISRTVLPMFLLTISAGAITFTLDGVFIGLGRMQELRNTLLISTGVFITPILFLGEKWSYNLLWWMIFLWVAIRGIIPLLYFYKAKQL